EIVTPNLYYFQPCPDDSPSPLFARQYEKVKHNESNGALTETQYHRIHPLHKWGLDLDHYKWIEWKINGNVRFVEYPNPLYHGKDYWVIPSLSDDNGRCKNATAYFRRLRELMSQYEVIPSAPPEEPQNYFEQEFKLMVNEDTGDRKKIFQRVKNILRDLGYEGLDSGVAREQVDCYFDDDNFHLYNNGASFRFRETKGSARVTLKVRPNQSKPQSAGEYRRIEEESTISIAQKEALYRGEKITSLPYRLIPYVAPDCGKLKHLVTVRTNREIMEVKNNRHQKAELCFDITHYEINGGTFGPDIEIEIESKGLPRKDIEAIASLLEDELKLTPSPYSKYERAVRYLK
ncbi:MAG TPA: CYTH domain-containing protein, partial [Desulfitobacteriaceae bacterium]|nr:CYTH domain-containing protein [Desulfitobacteriaceae bacterium]